MSDENSSGVDLFHAALANEAFISWLTAFDQLESSDSADQSCIDGRIGRDLTNGDSGMTINDIQRQKLQQALKENAFEDPIMRGFAEAASFELGDVLARARKLAGGDPAQHDTSLAGDIVVMIRGFKSE